MDTCEVSFRFVNVGNTVLDSLSFRYDLCPAAISSELYIDSVFPGDTIIFTFDVKYVSPLGMYCITVFSNLPNDTTYNKLATEFIGVNCSTGIQSQNEKLIPRIKIYPNPVTNNINLEFKNTISISSLIISNSLGQEVGRYQVAKGQKRASINIATLPAGIYFIRLEQDINVLATGKFVKE